MVTIILENDGTEVTRVTGVAGVPRPGDVVNGFVVGSSPAQWDVYPGRGTVEIRVPCGGRVVTVDDFLRAWVTAHGSEPKTLQEAVRDEDVRAAAGSVAPHGNRGLSTVMRVLEGNPPEGFFVVSGGLRGNRRLWRVEQR